MARTFYESSKDLDEEKSVATFLSSKWNLTFYKLKPSYKIDWIIFKNGQVSTVAEIKRRHVNRLTYDTLMLSLDKWMTGKAMAAEMKVPFMLLIKWDDGLFWYKAGVSPVTYGFGGRKDRQDPQDMEPVVFIPVRHFKEIK
jgi:hypothetical protein